MTKFAIYVLSTILVIWSIDAVNINAIFKKNKVMKAQVFYFILALCLIYLLSNFIYDFVFLKFF